MNKEELLHALNEHKCWLNDGALIRSKGKKLNLEYEVIEGGANDFDLSYATAYRCIFRNVEFIRCKFPSANLQHCDFYGCTFDKCFFNNSQLSCSKFESCDFKGCTFSNCDFSHATLSFTDYSECSLRTCSFRNSAIYRSSFRSSAFEGATRFEFANIQHSYLPDGLERILGRTLKKPIVVYKNTRENVVIKAEIPAGAIVFSINGKKCRTNRAKIVDMCGHDVLHSSFDITFTYTLGQEIEILDFDPCYNHECAPGFHFFMTEREAEEYRI